MPPADRGCWTDGVLSAVTCRRMPTANGTGCLRYVGQRTVFSEAYPVSVQATANDGYVAAFVSRCNAMARPVLGKPGVHGALSSADHPLTRLLITDDQAYEELAVLLPAARAGTINVFATAPRCIQLVEGHPGWKPKPAKAMICRDLRTVPALALPNELTYRPVRRLPGDAPDGVPLPDAVAVAMLTDRSVEEPPAVLADYLRSLTPAFRLFAAIDCDGAVRATAGWGAFGAQATVIFVNTDPGWRRRGIGQAMTSAALRAALDAGASQACLDASDAGLSIYRRLGFEIVAGMMRFSGPD